MKRLVDFFIVTIGTVLVALGIYFFKVPNKFATGGVSGISIIASHIFPGMSVGGIMLFINIFLLIVGFIILGSSFGIKTVYSSLMMSGAVWLLERVYPMPKPFTEDTLLELVFAIFLPAVGSALLFNRDASTGGTDIVAMILSKYTQINIGKALLAADFIIALGAAFVFGIRAGMYSVFGLLMKALVIDYVIEGLNICKQLVIVSSEAEKIEYFIVNTLKRGATVHKAEGAFTHEEKQIITTVVSRKQAIMLRRYIKELDSRAFITITNTSEIIGKGFRSESF